MIDRGFIKWAPFDSCFPTQKVMKDLINEKNKIRMPHLSEDQENTIEKQIVDAYNLRINVELDYYYDGMIKHIQGKIYNIDIQEKKIYLNNKFIYVKQILKINY